MTAAGMRAALLDTFRTMGQAGLNHGTSGNASVRLDAASGGPGFLVTPSSRPIDSLAPADLVVIR